MAKTQTTMDPRLGLEAPIRMLAGSEAHVWKLPLDIDTNTFAYVADFLSPDEKKKADRFQFDIHRRRFIAGRGLLRLILGRCCDVQPAELRFDYAPNGKPRVRRSDR